MSEDSEKFRALLVAVEFMKTAVDILLKQNADILKRLEELETGTRTGGGSGESHKPERQKRESRDPGEFTAIETRVLDAWNSLASETGLSKVGGFTSGMSADLRTRLKELQRRPAIGKDDEKAVAEFIRIMNTIRDQPFALGRVPGKKWKVSLQKFLRPHYFAGVESTNYGDQNSDGAQADGAVRDSGLFGDS